MEKQNFTRLEVLDIIAEIDDNGIDNEAITYVQILDTIINKLGQDKQLTIPVVSFELPSDEIFDMPEVNLKNPLEEFYYYERPPYLKNDQKDFKERLQKALNYLKGN